MSKTVDNEGIGAVYGSFSSRNLTSEDVGKAVAIGGDGTVDLARYGQRVLGRLEHQIGKLSTVQMSGVAVLPYHDLGHSTDVPQVGTIPIGDEHGYVRSAINIDERIAGKGEIIHVDWDKCLVQILL